MTARGLRRAVVGRSGSQLIEILAVASATRYYARNLAVEVQPWSDAVALDRLTPAAERLGTSLDAVERRIADTRPGTYVRSAALFDLVDRALPPDAGDAELVVRDLMLLDGALARLATALSMPVVDHDTTGSLPVTAAP